LKRSYPLSSVEKKLAALAAVIPPRDAISGFRFSAANVAAQVGLAGFGAHAPTAAAGARPAVMRASSSICSGCLKRIE